jgi:hypothetical protein
MAMALIRGKTVKSKTILENLKKNPSSSIKSLKNSVFHQMISSSASKTKTSINFSAISHSLPNIFRYPMFSAITQKTIKL